MLHGTYLRKDAPRIKYGKLISFNSIYNFIDYKSKAFKELSIKKQNLLR